MNVFFPFIGNKIGGSDISAVTLIENIRKEKNIKTIQYLHCSGILEPFLKKKKINFLLEKPNRVINRKENFIFFLKILFPLFKQIKLLRSHKIDIVHTNDNFTHYCWSISAKLAGCKVVWHKRNTDRSKRILFFSLFSDKIVTISNYVHKELPSFLKKKSIMVYNPFFFKTSPKNNYNKLLSELNEIKKKKKIIGFISNFSSRKKPDFFMKIAKHLVIKKKEENLFFAMFGDFKEYNPSFRKEIKDHNLTNHLKLFGFVEKVDEIMSCLDLIICPAEKEPFGRVLIEAMKNKVPIVASRSGAHQEIITNKKYGSLVEPDNFLEFVKHVKIKLVKNPSNLNRTFSYAIKKFNAEIHVKKIKKIYFELIKT